MTFWADFKRLAKGTSALLFGAGVAVGNLMSANPAALIVTLIIAGAMFVHARAHRRELDALIHYADEAKAKAYWAERMFGEEFVR